MTQNTQTTLERIAEMILRSIEQSIFNFDTGYDADPIAKEIAAEIDALTAERDEAQRLIGIYGTSRDAVIAQLGTEIDRLTAERDGLKAALAASWPNLSAQLSEARANLRLAEIRINGFINGQEDAAAEVERLRLPAEAWEAMEAWRNPSGRTVSGVDMAYKAMVAAAARARAAKERKP